MKPADRVAAQAGLVAFWTFAPDCEHPDEGWHSRAGLAPFPLRLARIGDHRRYGPRDWPGQGPGALHFASGGPFGRALGCRQGHIFAEVARASFEGTTLDLHGRRPCTLICWARFVGARHLIAGIWDEGGWDRYGGRRQLALFAGLFQQPGVIAHISATGAASFPQVAVPGAQYARLRAIDGQSFADGQWVAMAMTVDPQAGEISAWLNGHRTPVELRDPVAAAALGPLAPAAANPFPFSESIYHPTSPLLKFHGYDVAAGIREHACQVDGGRARLRYRQRRESGLICDARFCIEAELERDGQPSSTLTWEGVEDGIEGGWEGFAPLRLGDRLRLRLFQDGVRLGAELTYTIPEGAPFTLGRALGLGSDEPGHGSELDIDGVAVFDRVLSAEELRALSLVDG